MDRALTLITDGHVPDETYAETRAQFDDHELANLTLAVIAINGANRLNIAFRTIPGSYRPALHAWMVGAIGLMTLAVMTRASLGHSGHELAASVPMQVIYFCALVAALTRIAAAFERGR